MKKLIILVSVFLSSFVFNDVFAYDAETTHVSLAERTIHFYNLAESTKLTDLQKKNIIQGSIDEDNNARALNHFYDPVIGTGLKGARSALDWITQGLVTNEYGWKAGIKYYAEGKEDLAFLTLGHILHLIEDMAVPDHTRDDGHAGVLGMGRSSLEDYAHKSEVITVLGQRNNLDVENSFPEEVTGVFSKIALYSNNNFFSDDTIYVEDNIANQEKPLITKYVGKYGYSLDEMSNVYEKTVIKETDFKGNIKYSLFDDYLNDYSVLSSYFSRLSEQAILAGIQTIKAFIKEGEKARAEYLQKKAEEAKIAAEKQAKALTDYNSRSYLGKLALNWWNEFTQPFTLIGGGFLVATNFVGDLTVSGARTGLESSQLYGNLAYGYSGEALSTGGEMLASAIQSISNNLLSIYNNLFDKKLTNNTASSAGLLATNQVAESKKQKNQEDQLTQVTTNKKVDLVVDNNPVDVSKKVAQAETEILANSPIKKTLPPAENISTSPIIVASTPPAWGGAGDTGSYISTTPPPATAEEKPVSPAVISDSVCDKSFGLNDCVVATTTATIFWQSPDADITYYQINQNGSFSTTTATSTEIQIENNTSANLEVSAVNTLGQVSATTTKKISVTTNPIIFNEIAWGGTIADERYQWFELYNRSPFDIQLDNFKILAERGIMISLSGKILAHKYFLIARQEPEFETTVFSDLTPDLSVSFGSDLYFDGEYLSLTYGRDNLIIDVADFSIHGYGPCGRGCTSEYYNNDWFNHNSDYGMNGLDADSNAIFGTPGKRNTASYQILNDGQNISENLNIQAEEENTPVIVPRTLFINQGATLYLNENTTLRFMPGTNLYINGQLVAEGTLEKPINFETISDSRSDKFDGLTFSDASSTSLLKNVTIENSKNGIVISYGGSLVADNLTLKNFDQGFQIYRDSELLADGLNFANSRGDNFIVYHNSTSTVSNLTIDKIEESIATVYLDSSFRLSSSTLENASSTVFEVFANSAMDLNEVTIKNVEASSVIYVYSDSSLTLTSSSIKDGTGNGITVFDNGKVEMENSEIGNMAESGLEVYLNGEVDVADSKLVDNNIGAVVFNDGSLNISSSTIAGNTEYGVLNFTPDSTTTIAVAENNWWGSTDGPTTTEALALTTDGLTPDRVSAGVVFSPWLATTSELTLE